MSTQGSEHSEAVLCSRCFNDQGLKLDSFRIGFENDAVCPNCGSNDGRKLSRELIARLAHRFFVRGTIHRTEYGGAPVIQFNEHQRTSISAAPGFESDLKLFEKTLGVGFFHYGPLLWMVGQVEPLKALQEIGTRAAVISRIVAEYPQRELPKAELFYRVRRNPSDPSSPMEYDSPPKHLAGKHRLDSVDFPVLYGSQDLEVCVHECRVTVDDEVFVATLGPLRPLRLLDLTVVLQEGVTEFESLDITVHMLFLAGEHSYEISRAIAIAGLRAGYDGLIYPSYFSLVRSGAIPFETAYGLSIRIIPQFAAYAESQAIPNLALFGRPIEQGVAEVRCINKLVLNRVEYDLLFGPVGYV